MLPSASEIQYFVEVANCGNLSRAAERLGVTQPTLSQAIQKLEHNLKCELFFRSKRGVTLTPSGKRLLVESENLLTGWKKVADSVFSETNEVSGNFKLGVHPSVALYTLSLFFKNIYSVPNLSLRVHHDLSRKLTEGVISSDIDLAIVVNPVSHPDLVRIKLAEDIVTMWKSKDKNKLNTPGSGEAVLIMDGDLIQSQSLSRKINRADFSKTFQTSSLELICDLVMSGNGVGIIPERVARNYCGNSVVKIDTAAKFRDEIYLVFRSESKSIAAVKFLVETIKSSF